jgi:hypothetical protein
MNGIDRYPEKIEGVNGRKWLNMHKILKNLINPYIVIRKGGLQA